MKRKLNLFRKRGHSIAENEAFVTLIRVAQEDPEVLEQLVAILRLDDFNRNSALNTYLEEMHLKQAPKRFVSAIANLLDDDVADKVLKILTEEKSSKSG